jgi:hypothetical protein
LLWLFLGWSALLLGALLAANLRWWGAPDDSLLRRGPAERFNEAHALLGAMAAGLGAQREAALPATRFASIFDGDPRRAAETAGLLVSLGYLSRFVTLTDLVPLDERPGLRKVGLLARLRGRRADAAGGEAARSGAGTPAETMAALPLADPIWSERWAWAADPATLSLRALFDAFWQPADADSSDAFPASFLDAALAAPAGE